MSVTNLHHIVIVGGGAGGLELAIRLGKKLGKRKRAKITLLDFNRTHIWKPLLHEVAAGTFDSYENQVEYMAQANSNYFEYRQGRMHKLDRKNRIIYVEPTYNIDNEEIIPQRQFTYDTLIMSVGSVSNDFGIEGVREHCMFLDTKQEAQSFQNSLLETYIKANTQKEEIKPGQLDVVIAGAGATGVELSAQLYKVSRLFTAYGLDQINPAQINIHIVDAADRILTGLPVNLSAATHAELTKLNINVITSERVVSVDKDHLITHTGREIPAAIKVWAAGIKAPEFIKDLDGLETNNINQLVVKQTLQTTNDENIFAMGDCAQCDWPEMDSYVPPRAQSAHQQASLLAKTICARLQDRPLPEFKYKDYGSLVSLGKYSTVGNLMGNLTGSVMIEGFFARMMYLSLYKMHQLALFGFYRTMMLSIAHTLRSTVDPKIKLH